VEIQTWEEREGPRLPTLVCLCSRPLAGSVSESRHTRGTEVTAPASLCSDSDRLRRNPQLIAFVSFLGFLKMLDKLLGAEFRGRCRAWPEKSRGPLFLNRRSAVIPFPEHNRPARGAARLVYEQSIGEPQRSCLNQLTRSIIIKVERSNPAPPALRSDKDRGNEKVSTGDG
jgi:hypothetical protein